MIDPNIGESLHRLLHAYKRALRQAYQEAELPLSVSHMRAMKVINHSQQNPQNICTAQLIAQRLQRDKAQITRLIKDLLGEELIEKHDHPEDRRSQVLMLTPKGRSMVAQIRDIENLAGHRMATGLNAAEISDFIKLANTMAENLKPTP